MVHKCKKKNIGITGKMKENWYILQIMPDAEKYGSFFN